MRKVEAARDRTAYFAAYLDANRPRIYQRAKSWRQRNLARVKAHDRLRYLVKKLELSEGEMAQIVEIRRMYPKRGISWS